MMNFLPQGYSFESRSNPYESQFVSPFYGSGQYGWQYSPMAQTGPRLPTCQPGTCPPWLPPGLVATPSSGVQELSVLFDPTLAARMSRAYNSWTVAYWGKPDIPAWLWPDGAYPRPVPPNVCCEVPPCVGPVPPGGYGGGGGALTPGPSGGPSITPGWTPGPKLTPGPSPGPMLTPGPSPTPQLTPGPSSGPGITAPAPPSSALPNPGRWWRQQNGDPQCHGAGDKAKCFQCCNENATTKSGREKCLSQCVTLPEPKPKGESIGRIAARSGRMQRSVRRRNGGTSVSMIRARRPARVARATSGWLPLPGAPRGWCGPGEHLCTKKSPSGKSNFCCCRDGSTECAGGRTVLAYY